MNSAVVEYVCAPGLPVFVGRDLIKRKDCDVPREAARCVWAIAGRYERNSERTKSEGLTRSRRPNDVPRKHSRRSA
jgi:hypothetical protein